MERNAEDRGKEPVGCLSAGRSPFAGDFPSNRGEKRAPVLQTEAADEKSVSQAEELAERLEKVLSRVSGVGKTKVLVTLKSDGKRLVEKDSTTREDSSESRDRRKIRSMKRMVLARKSPTFPRPWSRRFPAFWW